ncbi:MAG: DNA repair protein RadC [Gammaproteobacteria bacterium]|nr:DNA repair protein RadC [Gammaproteobacteria bacterium]
MIKKLTIKNWPKAERPREKLLLKGAGNLSDAELLAIFLRVGVQGKTAIDLARDLLLKYGSLQKLLSIDAKQFCEIKGLGPAKYCQLQAILEMNRRYLFEDLNHQKILNDSIQTKQYLVSELCLYEREVFGCVFLDTKHQVIAFKELFHGSIDRLNIYPREIIREALKHNASAVIFAHNHPSGNLTPSELDVGLTKRLRDLFFQLDIKVLDHVIVGKNQAISLTEKGLI